ncbi:MAG TPA: efflux RND transporter periplasmic adaptor subunit [Beijerinckiaceae bacterium]|jgi:membrane fusion protein (multidrug efflux system)
MRWYGQLAVIAVLGGAGYGGYVAYKEGHLQKVPVLGEYVAKLAPAPAAPAGGPGGGPGGRNAPPPTVDVDTVRTGRIVEIREAVGTVRAFESITVTAKVSGIIAEIAFEEGQKVKAGDVLVRFDADERRADIEGAVAEIRRAEAQRNEIRTRLERAVALRRTGAGTEAQVEDLTAQVRTLDSAIVSAEARRKGAEARLEDLMVRAPFPGRLGSRSVSLGAYVSPGTKITTLDDLSRVRLDFSVPENLLGQLKTGQAVRAQSAAFGNRTFTGKVSLIDPRVDPTTRTVRMTADFENRDEALKPGMFLTVALEVSVREDAVVAQEEAVVNEGLRQLIFVVKDNKVERRVIRIGQRQEGKVEVLEGLNAGEVIIVRGVQRARPGATVTPKPMTETPATPTAANPAAAPAPTPAARGGAAPPAATQPRASQLPAKDPAGRQG